uniref:Sequence-variable mosaic (SVM) signal sequence domain-containing protein n=1 Tax=Phytoplasma sp. CPh TaxID=343511 RepID=Q2LKX7_9MOLU|nr:hypothetical protein [Phytoplasma sp. CPh]
MLIFRLKKQLYLLTMVLFSFLGLFLFTNNHQVMAMNNLNDENSINNELNKLYSEKEELITKISYLSVYHLDGDIELRKQLDNLDKKIEKFCQRLSAVKILSYINEQIWHYSYERNQIAIKTLSLSNRDPSIKELNVKHQQIIKKIKNLSQKHINLQYKLNN